MYLVATLVNAVFRAVTDERLPPEPLDHLFVHLGVAEHEDVEPARPLHDHVATLVSHRAARHLKTSS